MSITLRTLDHGDVILDAPFFLKAMPLGGTLLGYAGDGASTDLSVSGGVAAVANGGTGRSTLTPGALLYASGTNSTGLLGPATAGKVVISVGAAPAYSAWTLPASFPKGSVPYASAAEQVSALLSPAAASVLVHAGGTGLPSWSSVLARALLPSALAYEDEANVFTGGVQTIHPVNATATLKLVGDGVVAGVGYSNAIEFWDGAVKGGSFQASFSNSSGNRALEFLGGTDRDGNRTPVRLAALNAAGSTVGGIGVGSGTSAGSIGIGSTGFSGPQGQIFVRAVGTILGGATTQYGGFFDTTFASDATVAINGFYVRAKTPAAAFTVPDLVTSRIASASLGAGSAATRLFGLYIEAMTAGATNYALATFGGDVAFANAGVKVGIGLGSSGGVPTAPSAVLHIVETSAGAVPETVRLGNQSTTSGSGTEIGFHASSSGAQKYASVQAVTEAASAARGALVLLTQRTSSGGPVEAMRCDGKGNVSIGTAALSTSATDGYLYIPTCAGTPSGTPTAKTGLAPLVYDSTNNKLYAHNGGAWKSVTLT